MREHDGKLRLDKRRALEAAYDLLVAFTWVETVEGFDFWNKVHDRLMELGNGKTK